MKHLIGPALVQKLAQEIELIYPHFPKKNFLKISATLEGHELKARVLRVTAALKKNFPENYLESLSIIVRVLKNNRLSGFDVWPFSEFIGQFGLNHFDESLEAMTVLTEKFTAEFAVRPFFLKDQGKVLAFLSKNISHPNHHVRRWISEGSRPLLPWGERLPQLVIDPRPTLKLLEMLRFDDEIYVRKSVANHLNDISKHHPALVIETIGTWIKTSPDEHVKKILWIRAQGLRTLIKKGNKDALKLMGVKGAPKVEVREIKLNKKKFKLGDRLEFTVTLSSTSKTPQRLVIDYLIDFQKANGKTAIKVFKLKVLELSGRQELAIKKSHSLKKITTMTYYKGLHRLMIQVNGKILSTIDWQFLL